MCTVYCVGDHFDFHLGSPGLTGVASDSRVDQGPLLTPNPSLCTAPEGPALTRHFLNEAAIFFYFQELRIVLVHL